MSLSHGQFRSTLKSVFPEPFKCCQSTKEVWTGQTRTEVKCTWKWCASAFDLWEFNLHWLKNAWKHLCDRLEIMLPSFLSRSSRAQNQRRRIKILHGDPYEILERYLHLTRHSMKFALTGGTSSFCFFFSLSPRLDKNLVFLCCVILVCFHYSLPTS